MIQLTGVFYLLFIYDGADSIWLQQAADSIIRDPIQRRALYALFDTKQILTMYAFKKNSRQTLEIFSKGSPVSPE